MNDKPSDEMPDYVRDAFMRGDRVERIHPPTKMEVVPFPNQERILLHLEVRQDNEPLPLVFRVGLSAQESRALARRLWEAAKNL